MVPSTTAVASAAASSPSGSYIHWGVINISVTNLAIIGAMLLVFVLALVLPFPHGGHDDRTDRSDR